MPRLLAHVVLLDAERAVALLEDAPDPAARRVLWVAAVTLLRAVGHILEKVDSESSPQAAAAISKAWAEWSSNRAGHSVFWDFVKPERDIVLKEYEFGFSDELSTIVVDTPDGPTSYTLAPEVFLPSKRNPGVDARDDLQDAIGWWLDRLNEIEDSIDARGA